MKKKTRQVKARPIAAREQFDSALDDNGIRWQPIWTLPRTPEAWDAMEEAGAKALHNRDEDIMGKGYARVSWTKLSAGWRDSTRAKSAAVLTALALVRPTTKQGGGK